MKPIIFFDMDGVLAKWDTASSYEDTFVPGYFLSREPDALMIDSLHELVRLKYNVMILSAVYPGAIYHAEKEEWLRRYGINVPAIFLPCGENKANYVSLEADQRAFLVDDYTRNLNAWESTGAGFVGVKYLNGINNSRGTWRGYRVSNQMDSAHIVGTISAIASL